MLGFDALGALPIGDAGDSAPAPPTADAVFGAGAATLDVVAAGAASHGVRGAGAVTLDIASADAAVHGVAGAAGATLTLAGDAHVTHLRYELRGEVRQAGVLVNRRVRAYLRSTGAMIAEGDTVAGKFHLHTGFAPGEHYIVPLNLDDAATDWTPPVANRVSSVLAQDV